jgi:hypothetical protein
LLENAGRRAFGVRRANSAVPAGLALALAIAVLLAPLADAAPDGLSRVAQRLGFQGQARRALAAPFADYGLAGLGTGVLATIAVGCLGTLFLFALCWLLARALVPRPKTSESGESSASRIVESSG